MLFFSSRYVSSLLNFLAQMVKQPSTRQETRVQALVWEDPLEKEMAIHSSTIAWKIPWTEEPGRLQSMGSQRVGHDWATPLHSLGTGNDVWRSLIWRLDSGWGMCFQDGTPTWLLAGGLCSHYTALSPWDAASRFQNEKSKRKTQHLVWPSI